MEKRCFSAKKYAGSGIGIGGKHTPNMPDMTDRKEKPQNLVVIFGSDRVIRSMSIPMSIRRICGLFGILSVSGICLTPVF